MKETYNWKSLFAGAGIIVVGIVLCVITAFTKVANTVFVSIGCSLIASGAVIILHDFFVEKKQVSLLDEQKIERIYSTRAEKSAESDLELLKAKYCLDAVAFGLSSFRGKHTPKVETLLRKGINIRIITMNPSSPHTQERDDEEKKNPGATAHSIFDLIDWANKLNRKDYRGKVIIQGYNSMTLDFYWRVDDTVYTGPYWYGVDSQQTITFRFVDGGNGFSQYTQYFEDLWNNETLTETLTDVKEVTSKKAYRSKR